MTLDVRGAAAHTDHGVGGNRLWYSASVSSACGLDSRRSDSRDSVSNVSRISLNSDAPIYTAPSSAARCRMASSDITVMLLLFSSRPVWPRSSDRTANGLRLGGGLARGLCGGPCVR